MLMRALPLLALRLLLVALCVAWVPARVSAQAAQMAQVAQVAQVVLDEDSLLFARLLLDDLVLSETLEIHAVEDRMYLPLIEISKLIEFKAEPSEDGPRVSGWLDSPAASFSVDLVSGEIRVMGKARARYPESIIPFGNEVFMEQETLADLLGFPVIADRYEALVSLKPEYPLPLQERLLREKRGGGFGYGPRSDPGYPAENLPYGQSRGASLDFSVSKVFGFRDLSMESDPPTRTGMLLSGDFLWMTGFLGLEATVDQGGFDPSSLHVSLHRKDEDGRLLGLLGAREISLGNVSPVAPPLVGSGSGVFAASISNYPLFQPSYFDLQTLEGYLAPQWDVELYRNGVLLDYRPAGDSGSYRFADIPLSFGRNELVLEFRGPFGQRRRETYSYNVGTNMIRPGNLHYRASVSAESGLPRVAFMQDFGLSRQATIGASAVAAHVPGGWNLYPGIGFAGYFSDIQADAHLALDLRGIAPAGDAGLRFQVDSLGVSLRFSGYGDGWIPAYPVATATPYRYQLYLGLQGLKWIPSPNVSTLSPTFRHTVFADGSGTDTLDLQETIGNRLFRVRNQNTIQHRFDGTATHSWNAAGTVSIGSTYRDTSIGADLSYGVYPAPTADRIGLNLELPLPANLRAQARGDYRPSGGGGAGIWAAEGALYYQDRTVRAGVTGTWNSGNTWAVSFSFFSNVSADLRDIALVPDSRQLASMGSVSVRVFVDSNFNSRFDPGEKPLEGVGFFVNDISHETFTGSDGIAFLRGLAPNMKTGVSISRVTLEDILMVPVHEGRSCVTRPGTTIPLDFPVWLTGEIAGTVYKESGREKRALPKVRVELVGEEGLAAGSTYSAYDGYFQFVNVRPGRYIARVTGDQAGKPLSRPVMRRITVPANGGYVDGVDLLLPADPVAEPAAAQVAEAPVAEPVVAPVAEPTMPSVVAPIVAEPAPSPVVEAPRFGLPQGKYAATVYVPLITGTEGASIRYTLGDEDPGPESGLLYTGPLVIGESAIVKAIALKEGWIPSPVADAAYLILRPEPVRVPVPDLDPIPPPIPWLAADPEPAIAPGPQVVKAPLFGLPQGKYHGSATVPLQAETAGSVIRYSVGNEDPGPDSGLPYTGPLEIGESTIVKAIALRDGWISSPVVTAAYIILNPESVPAMAATPATAATPAPSARAPVPAQASRSSAAPEVPRIYRLVLRFHPDSATPLPGETERMRKLAMLLGRSAAARNVVLEGHAARAKTIEGQKEVSRLRARFVSDWLVAQGITDARRLSYRWMGADVPLVPNSTAQGMALNRRVEVLIELAPGDPDIPADL